VARKVALDPGHGGRDPGAVGPGGIREAEVNLLIALELKPVLERAGFEVLLTRTGDRELGPTLATDLRRRSDMVNDWGADACVSIHCNASGTADPGRTANGIETYALPGGRAEALARHIHRFLVVFTGAKDRGVRTNKRFWMLRMTAPPAVLVECGYVTNAGECALLQEHSYRTKLALAMAAGIMTWTGEVTR